MLSRTILVTAIAGALLAPAVVAADPIEFDFYGSLRLQYEAVSPDSASSYTGFRDAYSRIGFNASAPLADGVDAFAQLELPLNLAIGEVTIPDDHTEDLRIARIGLSTDFGTFIYGQDWMPYYNAITFPIDMFSTYYSGFGTFTSFRLSDSVIYYSPDFNGLSFGASYTSNWNGDDDRYQLTASYNFGNTVISAGIDDRNDDDSIRFWGVSLMHTIDNLYIGAKLEYAESDKDAGFGADGDTAANLYAGYTMGPNVIKAMVAEVDNFGGTIFHLGIDHNYTDRLAFFAEYYNEDEGAAIPRVKARDGDPNVVGTADGGDVFAIGARYSF